MQFVRIDKVKEGMRLARPIYNRNGVLLFDSGTKLSSQAINSVKNFKLIGLYILEPAEPVLPLSDEDIAFERFQAEYVYRLMDEMLSIIQHGRASKLAPIISALRKNYGHLEGKIQFLQSLRSREDFIFKHSLNTAILATLIVFRMKMKTEEAENIMISALLHDIGKAMAMQNQKNDNTEDIEDLISMPLQEIQGFDLLGDVFSGRPNIKRICRQTYQLKQEFASNMEEPSIRVVPGCKVLMVADYFDTMTAMRLSGENMSEIACVKNMMNSPAFFDPEVVEALTACIKLVFSGVSVELNTGDKGLVLSENPRDVLRPTVLNFRDNSVIDLSLRINKELEIVDVMKTMDNRYVISEKGKGEL